MPDSGAVAASLIADEQLSLWYVDLGLKREIVGFGDGLTRVILAPGGGRLATADEAGQIKLWDLNAPPLHREAGLPAKVEMISEIAGSGQVLLRTVDGAVVWDVSRRQVVTRLAGRLPPARREAPLQSLCNIQAGWGALLPPRPDDESDGAVVSFFKFPSGASVGDYRLRDFNREILLAPRGRRALAPVAGRKWELLVPGNGGIRPLAIQAEPLPDHEWSMAAAFSADGELVYLSPGPGWLEVFDAGTGRSRSRFQFAENQGWTGVNSITIHPSGSHALVGTMESTWRVDLETNAAELVLSGSQALSERSVFIADGGLLASEVGDRIHWWRWPDLTHLGDAHGIFQPVVSELAGDGRSLVLRSPSGPLAGELMVVATAGGAVAWRAENVIGAAPPLGLAAVVDVNVLRVVRLQDGEILVEIPEIRASHACFAADGSRIGVLLDSGHFVSVPLTIDRADLRARAMERIR
jgi:WD40 repeat protein